MKDFKRLKIWQMGMDLAENAFLLTDEFPKEQKFTLSNQITRAAVSVVSNIAEGSSRTSVKDYNRFIEMALGSAYELETQVLIAQKRGFGNPVLILKLLDIIMQEQRMLIAFMGSLKT